MGEKLDNTLRLQISGGEGQLSHSFEVAIQMPRLWLSAGTFLGLEGNVYPDEMIFYVRNGTDRVFRIVDCRLFLPQTFETWRWLHAHPWFGAKVRPFSDEGRIEPSDLGGARVVTGRLPLTYAAVEVSLQSEDGDPMSIWARLWRSSAMEGWALCLVKHVVPLRRRRDLYHRSLADRGFPESHALRRTEVPLCWPLPPPA